MRTIKKVAFGTLVIGGLWFVSAVQAATVSLVPNETSINVGESVEVAIVISGLGDGSAPSVSAFDLDLLYNSALLSYDSTVFGNQLDLGAGSFASADGATAGTVNVFELSFETVASLDAGQLDSFTLATVTVAATQVGLASFNLEINALGDSLGDSIAANVQGATINVVPIPAAAWLFGSALAGLGWIRRKQTS